jgi:hypothetical protein
MKVSVTMHEKTSLKRSVKTVMLEARKMFLVYYVSLKIHPGRKTCGLSLQGCQDPKHESQNVVVFSKQQRSRQRKYKEGQSELFKLFPIYSGEPGSVDAKNCLRIKLPMK